MITSTKLYVPVATSSINDRIKFSDNLKQGLKRALSWNKYRSEMPMQAKISNLQCIIDPTFKNINRLFVQLLKAGENDPTINFLLSIKCHK